MLRDPLCYEIKYLCKIATAGSKEARQLEKVKKLFEEAYRKNVKGQENTAEDGVKYSRYSRPNFTKEEWGIVNRRKHSEFDNPKYDLDNGNKWMYANEKGHTVFAIYSKNDAEDPTVLYGSSGKAATRDYAKVVAHTQGGTNANRGRTTLDRLLAYIEGFENQRSNGFAYPKGTLSATEDVSIPFEEPGSDGRGDYIDGRENLHESELTEYNEEAPESPGASSITFSNDYATIRNYMKDNDVGEELTEGQNKQDDMIAPISKSLSKQGETQKQVGDYHVYGSDFGYRDPLAELAQGTVLCVVRVFLLY